MRSDDELLLDLLLHAKEARELAAGRDEDQLVADREFQLALIKLIEIVGEAAARLSQSARARMPQIPWPEVIAMRHRLVHDYFRIDLEVLWAVVQTDLAPLIAAVEPLIPPEEPVP
jgi:uncharacterized protein with HEPN domain